MGQRSLSRSTAVATRITRQQRVRYLTYLYLSCSKVAVSDENSASYRMARVVALGRSVSVSPCVRREVHVMLGTRTAPPQQDYRRYLLHGPPNYLRTY